MIWTISRLSILILLALLPFPAFSMIQSEASREGKPQEEVSPQKVLLKEGSPVRLRIKRKVSSWRAEQGEQVQFEVIEDVTVGGVVVIPRGPSARAQVLRARRPRGFGQGGILDLEIIAASDFLGGEVPLRGWQGDRGASTSEEELWYGVLQTGGLGLVLFPFLPGGNAVVRNERGITAYVQGNHIFDAAKLREKQEIRKMARLASIPSGKTRIHLYRYEDDVPGKSQIYLDELNWHVCHSLIS